MGSNPETVEEELYYKAGLNLETYNGNIPVIYSFFIYVKYNITGYSYKRKV